MSVKKSKPQLSHNKILLYPSLLGDINYWIAEKVFTYLVTAALKNAESEMIRDLARCIVEDMIYLWRHVYTKLRWQVYYCWAGWGVSYEAEATILVVVSFILDRRF